MLELQQTNRCFIQCSSNSQTKTKIYIKSMTPWAAGGYQKWCSLNLNAELLPWFWHFWFGGFELCDPRPKESLIVQKVFSNPGCTLKRWSLKILNLIDMNIWSFKIESVGSCSQRFPPNMVLSKEFFREYQGAFKVHLWAAQLSQYWTLSHFHISVPDD